MEDTPDDINFEGLNVDFFEQPSSIGEDAVTFSASSQRDQFLGGGGLSTTESHEKSESQLSIKNAIGGMLRMGDPRIDEVYDEMKDKMSPMVFRLISPNGRNIFYVGTRHSQNISQDTREEQSIGIKTAFDEFSDLTKDSRKRIVLVEGSKPGILTDDYTTREDAYNAGEMGEITWMAKEAGIDVMSPDLPHDKTVDYMREQGIPEITIALNFAFRNLHSMVSEKMKRSEKSFSQNEVLDFLGMLSISEYGSGWEKEFSEREVSEINRLGKFDTPEGRQRIQQYIDYLLPQLNQHFKENSQFIHNEETGEGGIQLLVQKGADADGNPIYISEYDPERHYQALVNPFVNNLDNPKGILNRLSAQLSDNRDQYILSQLVEKVNDGFDVFIGFGNSHAIQESAGLISAGCQTSDYPMKILNSASTI